MSSFSGNLCCLISCALSLANPASPSPRPHHREAPHARNQLELAQAQSSIANISFACLGHCRWWRGDSTFASPRPIRNTDPTRMPRLSSATPPSASLPPPQSPTRSCGDSSHHHQTPHRTCGIYMLLAFYTAACTNKETAFSLQSDLSSDCSLCRFPSRE